MAVAQRPSPAPASRQGAVEFNLSFTTSASQDDSDGELLVEEPDEGAYSLKAEEQDDSELVVSKAIVTILQ